MTSNEPGEWVTCQCGKERWIEDKHGGVMVKLAKVGLCWSCEIKAYIVINLCMEHVPIHEDHFSPCRLELSHTGRCEASYTWEAFLSAATKARARAKSAQ